MPYYVPSVYNVAVILQKDLGGKSHHQLDLLLGTDLDAGFCGAEEEF